MIRFDCPHCHRQLLVNDQFAGRDGKCSSCESNVTIPSTSLLADPSVSRPVVGAQEEAATDSSLDFGDHASVYNVRVCEPATPRRRLMRLVLIALFVLAVLLVPLIALLLWLGVPIIPESEGLGKSIEYPPGSRKRFPIETGTGTVHYRDGASRDEAKKVGDYLESLGYFSRNATVQVRKPDGTYRVAFVVIDGAWNDPEMVAAFRVLRGELVKILGGHAVIVHLCESTVPVGAGTYLTLTIRKSIEK